MRAGEVAHYLAVCERTVWQLGKDGKLPRVTIKGSVRFAKADVDAHIARCRDPEVDPPHYVIYFMSAGDIGDHVFDSYAECLAQCEDEMIPVPVYGIPRSEPEEEDDGDRAD